MRPPSTPVFLLWCGLSMGCADLIGAEFKDFTSERDAATTPPEDGRSEDERSTDAAPIGDAAGERNAEDGETVDQSAPPHEGGGTTCTPGEVHDIAGCSNCGRYLQVCNAQGTWDPPFCEQAPGACAPGVTEQRACEDDGSQTATCTPSCAWTFGECLHSTCMQNQVEMQACGSCGTQSRSCQSGDAGWKWTPYSPCMDEKQCARGQVEREGCGKCGTHSRVCEAQCTWANWGNCQDEGPCTPGETEERGCLIGLLKQIRVCSDTCGWGDWIGLCL
ncbi:MAG TPA: hypothetical protein VK550_33780 [Polyangiaceae bacterium]|nr:hypothetical protein [Polyangiaceae bacterium]